MRKVQVVLNKLLPNNIDYKKYSLISAMLIIIGTFMSFYGVPQSEKMIVEYLTVLKPNHFLRNKHENRLPFTYKLYLWNVTNPVEIAAGVEKPKMQEVGPYVFSQFKQKIEMYDNKSEDTMSFDLWNIYNFNPQLSAPLTGDEMVTLVNTVLVAAVVKIKLESPQVINTLIEGMDVIFKNPSSIFVTMKAMEFIDKGTQVDCNQTAYAARVVCKALKKHKALKVVNEERTLVRYRWFDKLNDSIQARYTVLRGVKNVHDVGRIALINDKLKLKLFKEDDQCNVINGTDKLFFPPFQQSNDIIWVYSHDACKSFPLRYKYNKKIRGTMTAFKNLDLKDPLMSPTCECDRYNGCAVPGTLDMFYCLDIFIFGSLPHFYLAEPSILESMEGMNPQEHLHQTGVYFDMITGSPILSLERFQISWLVKRIPEYRIFSKIAGDIWIPVLWYDESFSLETADLALVLMSKIGKIVGTITGYTIMTIGIVRIIMALAAFYFQHHTVVVPKVPSTQPTN